MSEKMFNTRIIHKHDTAENWKKATGFIPKIGELIVYDPDENFGYARMKMGDGASSVVDLPFVSAYTYDWHEYGSVVGGSGLYVTNLYTNDYTNADCITDWDTLLSLTSSVNESYSLMYHLNVMIHSNLIASLRRGNYKDEDILKYYNNIVSDINKMVENNILEYQINGYRWRYIHSNDPRNTFSYSVYWVIYIPGSNQLTIEDTIRGERVIIRNGAIYQTTILPTYDTTLTYSKTAADAKAVGNALAQKIDKSEIEEEDALSIAMELNLVSPTTAEDDSIYTDENGVLYSL